VHLVPEDETTESLEPVVTTDPEVHASHSTACAPLYFPSGQAAHATVGDAEKWPAAHDVHLVPEDETTESLEPVVTTDAEVHASHLSACAPLYFPSGQAAHATVDDAEK
jgi:hypothetical protein